MLIAFGTGVFPLCLQGFYTSGALPPLTVAELPQVSKFWLWGGVVR